MVSRKLDFMLIPRIQFDAGILQVPSPSCPSFNGAQPDSLVDPLVIMSNCESKMHRLRERESRTVRGEAGVKLWRQGCRRVCEMKEEDREMSIRGADGGVRI